MKHEEIDFIKFKPVVFLNKINGVVDKRIAYHYNNILHRVKKGYVSHLRSLVRNMEEEVIERKIRSIVFSKEFKEYVNKKEVQE